MQLQLSTQVLTALHGTILISVGHNTKGLFASYRHEGGTGPIEAAEYAWTALLAALKIIGYYAKMEYQPGRKADSPPIPFIRFSTTQSYSASWLLSAADVATLAPLDQDALREVMGTSVLLYRRVAPAGRMFNELASVWVSADADVRKAIKESLRSIG